MVLREVEALLDKGKAVGAKPLKEYMEVQGYGDAAAWVYRQALEPGDWTTEKLLTVQTVRHVHHLAMNPVWQVAPHPDATDRETPGSLREHDIHPFGGGMKPPDWPLVPALLETWLTQVNTAAGSAARGDLKRPLPEALAELHNVFERMHPFLDGNGRTRRLLLNLMLVRLGYPPVIILKRQRAQYLAALQKADDSDYGPLGEILARAMYDNLNRFILPNLAGPARIVPLAALASEEFSIAALRQAAQRGRLDAIQGGGDVWRSSRKAVDHYRHTKGERRR